MKIAIFTDLYAPWGDGGIVASVKAQKDQLEQLGHEVTIFCPGFNAREKNVITVPSHKYLRVNGAVVAKRPTVVESFILERMPDFAKFDLVHVHYEASTSIAGVRLAKMFNLPLAQTMHGREDMAIAVNVPHPFKTIVATMLNFAHGRCLKHTIKVKRDKYQATTIARAKMWALMVNQAEYADVVLAPSNHFARKLEHYGVSKPVVTLSNGVPDDFAEIEVAQRELQEGDVLRMVWNSRASKEKRILPFLQALTLLKRPYLLSVYGNGNQLRKVKRYAEKHQLKVKFYGAVKRSKILQRMAESHLGIMASYNFDTQGMTLLEAEAMGLPVFFCDPAMVEIVPAGSYVLSNGPEAVAMAITLDNLPAEQIAKMSKIMLAHRKDATQSKQIQKLLSAYKVAIKNHGDVTKS